MKADTRRIERAPSLQFQFKEKVKMKRVKWGSVLSTRTERACCLSETKRAFFDITSPYFENFRIT